MPHLKELAVVALTSITSAMPASAQDRHWFEHVISARGGCSNVHMLDVTLVPVQSIVRSGQIDGSLFGKPILQWSEDDIATAVRLYLDCVEKEYAQDLKRCVQARANSKSQCEQAVFKGGVGRFEPPLRDTINAARNIDAQRKAQQASRIELERLQSQRKREQTEQEAKRKLEQLREQAARDRVAAEETQRLAETEESKVADATKEAEEARRALESAQQRLSEIRSRVASEQKAKQDALARTKAAETAQQQELQRGADPASPMSDYSNADQIVREICLSEWQDDFRMRAYCETRQRDAVRTLAQGKPPDISQDEFVTVRRRCVGEWASDFRMRAYCEGRQFAAIRKLRGGSQ